jgi:hypothetical protein
MSLDKNRILVECNDCGLIFRITEAESEDETVVLCDLIPEKDLGARKKSCKRED